MYAAKRDRSGARLYEDQLDEANRTRLELVQSVEVAIQRKEFVLHYQPKIDVRTGATVGAEALVRWEHPTRGLLYPDAFLPVVEQSSLMGALTGLVLEAAVSQLALWRSTGLETTVAVNLSTSDLLDAELAERIARLLREHAVPVGALVLEITESGLMTDPVRARLVLKELQERGLRIAVDDYGSGYCSLAYLRDLPIDELKIDRSFIAELGGDSRRTHLVEAIIRMAHALQLSVVAEGVETADQLDVLTDLGCERAQGYLFAPAQTAQEFRTRLLATATRAESGAQAPV
jgi:EAL domain-containing protein (putative c-di-GMP-specific phosphodiesterase class I)